MDASPAPDIGLPPPPGVIRRFVAAHPRAMDRTLASIYLGINLLIVLALGAFVSFTSSDMTTSSFSVTLSPETPVTTPAATEPPATPEPNQTADQATTDDELTGVNPQFGTVTLLNPLGQMIAFLVSVAIIFSAMWLRRRWVRASAFVIIVVGTLQGHLTTGFEPFAIISALYALAVYRSARWGWLGWLTATGLVWLEGWWASDNTTEWIVASIVMTLFLMTLTALFVNAGNRRRYTQALVERAQSLARERDQQALLAAVAERTRIAREMHDVVSHSLTVMVALSDGALAQLDRDPARARLAIERLGETGREAATEMRRMLGVLRDDTPEATRTPQPTSGDLWALVDSSRRAGLPVRLEVMGRMPDNPGLALTVYRIVQESLTNALRYAREATEVAVRVIVGDAAVEVTVTDNGRASDRPPTPRVAGSGHGLIGLRERVALYGGTLEAGSATGHGWVVRAQLPFDPPCPTDPVERAQPPSVQPVPYAPFAAGPPTAPTAPTHDEGSPS